VIVNAAVVASGIKGVANSTMKSMTPRLCLFDSMTYFYRAFGLTICSDVSLAGLPSIDIVGPADIQVRKERVSGFPRQFYEGSYLGSSISEDGIRIGLSGSGLFHVRQGSRIEYEVADGVSAEDAVPAMIAMCLGAILHQRGYFTLHASGVRMGDGCVAFVAHKGGGKSTTCANLVSRGYSVVTDDILAVSFDDSGRPVVTPAYPLLKLRPDAATSLGLDAADLPRLDPRYDRRRLEIGDHFQEDELPLSAIYFLEEGDEVALESVTGARAFVQLLTHSYVVRLLGRPAADKAHFEACDALMREVRMGIARRPMRLDVLPGFIDQLQRDVLAVVA
jgi:hypothetical protein